MIQDGSDADESGAQQENYRLDIFEKFSLAKRSIAMLKLYTHLKAEKLAKNLG